jgi:2-oxo-4-hydroxy-4-carboxy-5-ureidoimidazoline decarboxylase
MPYSWERQVTNDRAKTPIAKLNALGRDEFVALLGGVFEHSPWVAERAWEARPFISVAALHAEMVRLVDEAGMGPQLSLLRAHPELALSGPLTSESASEQHGLGLDTLVGHEAKVLADKNRLYHGRFGFPFIIAVRGQKDRAAIVAVLDARSLEDVAVERVTALGEVAKIARFRIDDLIADAPAATGRLTVHVLDTAAGRPAQGVGFSLSRIEATVTTRLGDWITNLDGRGDGPLLQGDALRAGEYEIVFAVGAWRSGPGFYDTIPIRFRIVDPTVHYHIPLLLSPFGYSTYRGS